MEHEIISKETPEMKLLISGIRNLTKRVRATAQTHHPLFEGELYLTRREVCERLFLSPRTLQDYGDKGISHIRRLQGRYSTDCQTCNKFCKRIIGNKVFARGVFLPFGSHTERTYRMIVQKILSNIALARYFLLITRHFFATD